MEIFLPVFKPNQTNAEIEPLNLTKGMEFSFDDVVKYLLELNCV